jgi:hypothetical protein
VCNSPAALVVDIAATVWTLEGDAPSRMVVRQRIYIDESAASGHRTPSLVPRHVLSVTSSVEAGDLGFQAVQDSEELNIGAAPRWREGARVFRSANEASLEACYAPPILAE